MKFTTTALFALTLVATHLQAPVAIAEQLRFVNTQLRLEGACAKIFGRTRINLGAASHQPIAPLKYDTNETGVCTVVVRLTDNTTSKPLAGIPVEVTKFIATDSLGTQDKALGTPKTDGDGNVTIKFRWDPTSCGIHFRPYDPTDLFRSSLINATTLLTGRALLQIQNCRGTFIEQGFSRDEICNGEPKNR